MTKSRTWLLPVLGFTPNVNNARPKNILPGGRSVMPSTLHAPPRSSRVFAQQPNISKSWSVGNAAAGTQFSWTYTIPRPPFLFHLLPLMDKFFGKTISTNLSTDPSLSSLPSLKRMKLSLRRDDARTVINLAPSGASSKSEFPQLSLMSELFSHVKLRLC